jgi:hypothetical protein
MGNEVAAPQKPLAEFAGLHRVPVLDDDAFDICAEAGPTLIRRRAATTPTPIALRRPALSISDLPLSVLRRRIETAARGAA